MTNHLLALQVVIPLLSAPLCLLLGNKRNIAWLFSLWVTAVSLLISIALLYSININGSPISYNLGGWPTPFGIEYRMDYLSSIINLIINFIAFVSILYARRSVISEINSQKIGLFYTAFLLCFTGLLGITMTGDAFNVFVFLEISSLSTYALVAMGKDRAALLASFRYLIMGTIGATFLLIGIGLLYVSTGTLNMADLASKMPSVFHLKTTEAGIAFIILGLSIKAAVFPMHFWLPAAYRYSPSMISAFLAGTATKVALYALIRFIFTLFSQDNLFEKIPFASLAMTLGLIAMFAGSLRAIRENDLRSMLAWSSVAQIGYIILGISLVSQSGLAAAITHIFNHALIKSSLFFIAGCIVYYYGSCTLNNFRGLGKQMPWTSAAFVICGLSLIGIPLTAGFTSKWVLVKAAFDANLWLVAGLVILSSLLAIIYIWKFIEAAYFSPPDETITNNNDRSLPVSMSLAVWLLVILNIYFGLDTRLNVELPALAASTLLGGIQ
ncbi:Na(+) H(+) antiporter subunit D [hydrothermal vent metagenome]|uniref:Na(+) H(+) antiporter subunit D n=1 Tax=hydrothermal vent metagenome TaxID=652676 RepID=A0A3B0Y3T5_9ZZZZ